MLYSESLAGSVVPNHDGAISVLDEYDIVICRVSNLGLLCGLSLVIWVRSLDSLGRSILGRMVICLRQRCILGFPRNFRICCARRFEWWLIGFQSPVRGQLSVDSRRCVGPYPSSTLMTTLTQGSSSSSSITVKKLPSLMPSASQSCEATCTIGGTAYQARPTSLAGCPSHRGHRGLQLHCSGQTPFLQNRGASVISHPRDH